MADPRTNPNCPTTSMRDNQSLQGSQTQTISCEGASTSQGTSPSLQLRLQPPREEHRVTWTSDTVDNEFMGKKKSKCCCIYEKPKLFGESSTSEDDEEDDGCTPHCRGHKKKCYIHKKSHHDHHDHDGHHDDHDIPPPNGATAT